MNGDALGLFLATTQLSGYEFGCVIGPVGELQANDRLESSSAYHRDRAADVLLKSVLFRARARRAKKKVKLCQPAWEEARVRRLDTERVAIGRTQGLTRSSSA